jgi:hypothetical protein
VFRQKAQQQSKEGSRLSAPDDDTAKQNCPSTTIARPQQPQQQNSQRSLELLLLAGRQVAHVVQLPLHEIVLQVGQGRATGNVGQA